MKRTLNVRFLLVFLATLLVVSGGLYAAYVFQIHRLAGNLHAEAEEAESRGDWPRAGESFKRYLDFRLHDDDALARYAVALRKQADSPRTRADAMAALDQALKVLPRRADIRRMLADLAMETGQIGVAVAHLEFLLKTSSSNNAELEELLADCTIAGGDYLRGAEWLEKVVQHKPDKIDVQVRLAALWRGPLNNVGRADEVMDRLVETNGKSFEAYVARARHRLKRKAVEEANEDMAQAQRLAPREFEVLLAAGECRAASGKFDEARKYLQQCVTLRSASAEPYTMLASLESQLGRRSEAIKHLRDGLTKVPEKDQEPLLLSLVDLRIPDGPQAAGEVRTLLSKLRAGKTAPPLLDWHEARLLVEEKQWGKAASLLQQLRPELKKVPALDWKSSLLLGTCFDHLGDSERSRESYRSALRAGDHSAAARLALASSLLNEGRLDEALAELQRLTASNNVPEEAWIMVAKILLTKNLLLPHEQRSWSEVDHAVTKAAAAAPKAAAVPILRAEAFIAQGLWQKADDVLTKALAQDAKQLVLWIAAAELAELRDAWERAWLAQVSATGLMGSSLGRGPLLWEMTTRAR